MWVAGGTGEAIAMQSDGCLHVEAELHHVPQPKRITEHTQQSIFSAGDRQPESASSAARA